MKGEREEVERIVKQAERIGWHNYADLGFGLQPLARYIGDGLGPLPRAITRTQEERDDG